MESKGNEQGRTGMNEKGREGKQGKLVLEGEGKGRERIRVRGRKKEREGRNEQIDWHGCL